MTLSHYDWNNYGQYDTVSLILIKGMANMTLSHYDWNNYGQCDTVSLILIKSYGQYDTVSIIIICYGLHVHTVSQYYLI